RGAGAGAAASPHGWPLYDPRAHRPDLTGDHGLGQGRSNRLKPSPGTLGARESRTARASGHRPDLIYSGLTPTVSARELAEAARQPAGLVRGLGRRGPLARSASLPRA